jgi:hypothetical protein
VPETVAVDVEVRIAELVEAHRPELEQLVDQALERELQALVEQRLAARNGALERARQAVPPQAEPALAAKPTTKTCVSCGQEKPASAFEKYRRACRDCRRREAREREQRRAADPERPATIDPDELRARSRVDGRRTPDVAAWAVAQGFARLDGDRLVPTAAAAVGGWIAPLGG